MNRLVDVHIGGKGEDFLDFHVWLDLNGIHFRDPLTDTRGSYWTKYLVPGARRRLLDKRDWQLPIGIIYWSTVVRFCFLTPDVDWTPLYGGSDSEAFGIREFLAAKEERVRRANASRRPSASGAVSRPAGGAYDRGYVNGKTGDDLIAEGQANQRMASQAMIAHFKRMNAGSF